MPVRRCGYWLVSSSSTRSSRCPQNWPTWNAATPHRTTSAASPASGRRSSAATPRRADPWPPADPQPLGRQRRRRGPGRARPPDFSRGDSNLLNWLWDGTPWRWWTTSSPDTATSRSTAPTKHNSSRQAGIDDHAWAEIIWLTSHGGGQDQRRFGAAQRTCALRCFSVLWKQRDNRTQEFTSQFDRVRHLQSATAAI
jgi:hypothetical protein